MSSLGSPNPFFIAGKKAYEVERSLRFNDGDSPWLERTVSSSSNRRTFTISAWVKRSKFGIFPAIFGQTDTSGSYMFYMVFDTNDQIYIIDYDYPSNNYHFVTNRKFRDPSAWYHIVLAVDTTQATNTNRSKLYINGVQETSFSTANYPAQNLQTFVNHTTYPVRIGRLGWGHTQYMDGYMAEYNFIDGLQLTPSSFGETNEKTGQWVPKKYVGSYGTNGFYLNFSDNSGTTATTLGKDSSGNGNNFTPNNFSVSAGAGNDSLEDTPTNNFCTLNSIKKDGQTTLSNGNLQASGSQTSTYNINTQGTFAQSSGKWYYEVEFTSGSGSCAVGWARTTLRSSDNPTTGGGIVYRPTSGDYIDLAANNPTTPPTTSTGTIIQVAIDFDAGKIWFGSGGTYFNSGDPSAGSNEAMTFTGGSELLAPAVRTMAATFNFNFGQRAFSYTVPTGYKTLCSANLPDPTILLPNKHFGTILYTGDNTDDRDITDSSAIDFTPDWVWHKARNATNYHFLFDSVRGATKILISNTNSSESTQADSLSAFITNGFTVSDNTANQDMNSSSHTYVAWNWNAGDTDGKTYTVTVVSDSGNKYRFDGFGTSAVTLDLAEGGTYIFDQSDSSNAGHPLRFYTAADKSGGEYTTGVTTAGTPGSSGAYTQIVVAASAPTLFYQCSVHAGMGGQANTNSTLGSSNFDGSVQATVKANATAGFSIIIAEAPGAGINFTVGHGLGVAPNVIFSKSRESAQYWAVYHDKTTDTIRKYLKLDDTLATTTSGGDMWGSAFPTSSVIGLSSANAMVANQDFVCYCFSEVEGYSKFGSYTGNGSSDGTFVHTGFRVRWVMIKRTNSAASWPMYDTARDPSNLTNEVLFADLSNAEATASSGVIDILSNGFKPRGASAMLNNNNSTYVYFAFAESPFKNARAR